MAGVKVPNDRTTKQPVKAFCRNPACREKSGELFTFYVRNDRFCCPKCKADRSPIVGLWSLTHLLLPHPLGPIRGNGGKRFVIACDNKRAYLATATNQESATGDPEVANCPGCLECAKQIPGALNPVRTFVVPEGAQYVTVDEPEQLSPPVPTAIVDPNPVPITEDPAPDFEVPTPPSNAEPDTE